MGRCRNIHGVTLGLGPGPQGAAPMVVGKYVFAIRMTGSVHRTNTNSLWIFVYHVSCACFATFASRASLRDLRSATFAPRPLLRELRLLRFATFVSRSSLLELCFATFASRTSLRELRFASSASRTLLRLLRSAAFASRPSLREVRFANFASRPSLRELRSTCLEQKWKSIMPHLFEKIVTRKT